MSIFKKIPVLTETQKIPALPACQDREMFCNPDRGLRHEIAFHLKNVLPYEVPAEIDSYRETFRRHVDYFEFARPALAQVYIYLTDFHARMDLPETVFTRIRAIFQILREHKLKALLRFTYQMYGDRAEQEEAEEHIMCAHMKQLFPIVEENLDVMHVFQASFLGLWGEWHGFKKDIDRANLMRNIVDNCPEPLFIQTRLPNFKNLIEDDDPRKARISHHNDSLFGEFNYGNGGSDPGTPQDDQIIRESPYLPVDGELFWGDYCANDPFGYFPDAYKVRTYLYNRHFTSLSIMHNYFENGVGKPYAMAKWRILPLTAEELKKDGMIYDPDYFAGERDVFEYIRDHLGYRLKAEKLNVSTAPDQVTAELDVVNYGFSTPHMLTDAGFALLDMDGKVAAEVSIGSIQGWQPHNIEGDTSSPLHHSAKAALQAPAGVYYLGFFARNSAGTPVRLANDVIFEKGFNIFGTVEIG